MGSGGSTARSENLQLGKVKLADWTEAEVVQLLKVFSSVDRDRSGSIDKAEMAALCRTQGRSADNFEEMDWDANGMVSFKARCLRRCLVGGWFCVCVRASACDVQSPVCSVATRIVREPHESAATVKL